MADIKRNDRTIFSTPINIGCKRKYMLMKEDYITLKFSIPAPISFKVGDFCIHEGRRYELTDKCVPSYNRNTGGYDYELMLEAYYMRWKNRIAKFNPQTGGIEASFNLTDRLSVHMSVLLKNIKEKYNGKEFTFAIDSSVEDAPKLISYNNTSVLEALNLYAKAWNCEWWVTDNIIHFGKCVIGDEVTFELGRNVEFMSRTDNKEHRANRFFVFGSERNIPHNYRGVEGVTVNGVVQKRLMLPEGTDHIDAYPISDEEAIESVLILDEVYPHRVSEVESVTTTEYADEIDGKKVKWDAYQIAAKGETFSNEYTFPDADLKVHFQSGSLNGLDFVVKYLEKGKNFEIIANEDYGPRLPNGTLKPAVGDKYILYGFDIKRVGDSYIPEAEQELKRVAEREIAKLTACEAVYDCSLMSDKNAIYDVGQRVLLKNAAYFSEPYSSRIIGYELNLDIPFDSPMYYVGDVANEGRLSALEEKVEQIIYRGQTYDGSGGIYLITSVDNSLASDFNAFSSKRTLLELERLSKKYVSKLNDDTVQGLITFTKGLKGGNWSINDKVAEFAKLLANEFSSNTIKSKGFKPNSEGFIIKVDENGKSYLEVDNALFRRKATFVELVTALLRHVGGQIILSPASMKCIRVEERDNAYRCYFKNTDGEKCIYNEFVVGDLARAQKFGSAKVGVSKNISTHYFWRAVVGVGDDYIDLSKTDCDKGSDAPKVGDDICQFGNKTDTDRQSVILLSAYGEYAGIYQFGGVNDYSLKGKEQTAISPSGNRFTGDFIVRGKNVTEIIDKSKTDAINHSNGYVNGVKNELDGKIGEVKGKIDGLRVGGRNLITKKGVWSDNSKLVLDNKDYPINLKASGSANHNSHPCIRLRSNSSFVPSKGDTITFSCYARTNKPYSEVIMLNRGAWKVHTKSQYSVSNEWKYITANLQLTEDIVDNVNFEIVIYLPTGRYDDDSERFLEIKYPKAEIGNIPTAWTQAPEDLELEIEQAKNEAISQAQSKFNEAVEQAKDLSTSAKADAIAEAQRGYLAAIDKSKQETTSAIDGVRDAVLLDAKDKYDKAVAEAKKLSGEAKDQAMADAKAKYEKAVKEANAYADRAKQQAIEEAKANTEREIKIVNNKFEATKEAFTSQYNEVKANLKDVSVKQTQIRQDVSNISLRADRAEEKVSGIDKRLSQAELKVNPDNIRSVVKGQTEDIAKELLGGIKTEIDATKLDENTYYPVVMFLSSHKPQARLQLIAELSSSGVPSWATHKAGFSCLLRWSVNGSGWGANRVVRDINDFTYRYAKDDVSPIGDVGQITECSREYVYVRGGGRYFVYSNYDVEAYICKEKYVPMSNYPNIFIEPKTSVTPPQTRYGSVQTEISQTKESITAKVLQGEKNVKQEVLSSFSMDSAGISLLGKKLNFVGLATFSAVNQAKTEAISEANKAANNAKSAAITEAQRKANEAKDAAIKDAQAKYEKATREAERLSGEAKEAAIKDAESKLEQAKADAQKKADAAISEAQNMVDAAKKELGTQITEAQNKAINDAQTKFNEAIKQAEQLSGQAKDDAIIAAKNELDKGIKAANGYADKVVKALAARLGSLAYSDKVGKAVLDETIIAGGFIKTSLINVQELAANEAFVNNLTAKRLLVKDKEGFDVVNLDGQTKTAMIAGMEVRNNHLYARKAQYGISNSITVGPLNFSLKRRDSNLVQTFSVNGGGLTSSNSDSPTTYVSVSPVVPKVNVPLIGHYIDVRDSSFSSIAGCEQNYALYIPRGIICGLRYRTRVVTSNYTLTPMDTFILVDGNEIHLYLPDTAEDGQLYIIRNNRDRHYTMHGKIMRSGSSYDTSDYTGRVWEHRFVFIKAKGYWLMSGVQI